MARLYYYCWVFANWLEYDFLMINDHWHKATCFWISEFSFLTLQHFFCNLFPFTSRAICSWFWFRTLRFPFDWGVFRLCQRRGFSFFFPGQKNLPIFRYFRASSMAPVYSKALFICTAASALVPCWYLLRAFWPSSYPLERLKTSSLSIDQLLLNI